MRIIILTQSDPFYLAENIDYLLNNMPSYAEVVATVLFDVSPFGKKESFVDKALKTYKVFGFNFFIHYGFNYVLNKFNPKKDVAKVLHNHSVPIIRLEKNVNNADSLNIISSYKPDLLISIAGNQIFKKTLIDLAPLGCLNLHTALLPKYRGLMPSFWVLKNEERETGVSVFFVDEGIDSGDILVQKTIPITPGMTQQALIKKSKRLGMKAIIEAIELIDSGNYQMIPNDDAYKSYYSFPTKEDVKEFYRKGKRFY